MNIIEVPLKHSLPVENSEKDWSEVVRLAREQVESLLRVDAEVDNLYASPLAADTAPSEPVMMQVHGELRHASEKFYRAVMEVLYGKDIWPWVDERTMDILT